MSRHLVSKLSELSNFYPPRNYQKIYGLSDSFRGNRRWLNRLSLPDIRSEVWGSRPQEFWKKTLLNILPKFQGYKTLVWNGLILDLFHCVKSGQIRSFFWSVFSRIRTEYGEMQSISPYSVWMRENTDQKKHRIRTLSTQSLQLLVCMNWLNFDPSAKTWRYFRF